MGVDVVVGGACQVELRAVRALFDRWDQVFSRFRAESELNRVNGDAAADVHVSRLFARVTSVALDAARATDGLVDPTLGVALEAAGSDREARTARGRWREVDLVGSVVRRPPSMTLDLNGVVKSLAVDEALALLGGNGFVAAGGDIATRGPTVVGLPADGSVTLTAGGLATSGTTKRRWMRAGTLQHHLIDPRTGRPSRSRWREVTVAAGSCAAADVAAKAAFLLDDDGPGWLDERGLPGRFVAPDELVVNRVWHESEAVAA
jgi:FAD:protein FMN transferase